MPATSVRRACRTDDVVSRRNLTCSAPWSCSRIGAPSGHSATSVGLGLDRGRSNLAAHPLGVTGRGLDPVLSIGPQGGAGEVRIRGRFRPHRRLAGRRCPPRRAIQTNLLAVVDVVVRDGDVVRVLLDSIADSKVRSPSGESLHSLFTANGWLWSIHSSSCCRYGSCQVEVTCSGWAPVATFLPASSWRLGEAHNRELEDQLVHK